jgi:hypothetical protein
VSAFSSPEPVPALEPDDLAVICWVLVQDAGHLDCGSWSADSRDGRLICACGAILFELVELAGMTP